MGVLRELRCREFDGYDEFAGLEVGVELRGGAGETMEVCDGDGALASCALDVDGGVKGGERDVHVRGVGGDAGFAAGGAFVRLSEDGMDAVDAFYGGAPAAGGAFVAGRKGGVHEVVAASALQEVAAGGGHIAELRGRSGEESL